MASLKEIFGPTVSKALTPAAVKNLTKQIGAYVDQNSEILLSMDLSARYSFADKDRQVLYDAIQISEDELRSEIAKAKNICSTNKVQSNPFYMAVMLACSHLLEKKDEATVTAVLTYMSLMMYTSMHKGFFKYEANKQVMDYTLANINDTFLIRKFPSLFAFIQDNTKTALDTYRNRIIRGTNEDFTWVIDALWTRLKGKMRKISNEYYVNHKAGNYLNVDEDIHAMDHYRDIDNMSFAIDRLTNKVYTKLINRQFDRRFIRYSISTSDTSYQKLTNLIEDIIDGDGEDKKMWTLISSMIEFYCQQSGRPIEYVAKGDFVAFMKTAFGSNTEVKQMVTIKSTIDEWLADNMYKYGRMNYGKTLRTQYRRCIYMFFVFVINFEAKVQ